jgi:osmotically-inducible protein OsmY
MKRLPACLLLIAGALMLPLWAGQKPAAASTEDDRIIDQVRMRLAGDADVKGGALDVAAKDGEVVIKGRVDTEKGKSKATKLAKKVKGVKSVDNELSVGPPV